jgi:2-hydroxychromene-2-carboxylate isomerase
MGLSPAADRQHSGPAADGGRRTDARLPALESLRREAPGAGLPSLLLSARVVVISDFNCPYCFTLNEWLSDLDLAATVRWVGVEHKPHLPGGLQARNLPEDLSILEREVADVSRRAPEVGVTLPPVWVNSRRALLVQAFLEDEAPQLAHRVRRELFHAFWREGRDLSAADVIAAALDRAGVAPPGPEGLDGAELDLITAWWAQDLDRIPCMLAPTGARHLGLQERPAVEAFVLGALRDRRDGHGCR